jgi:Binding-protein-dependent transport system inner membrane component
MRFYCIFLDSTSQSVKDSEELDEQHFGANLLQIQTGLAAMQIGRGTPELTSLKIAVSFAFIGTVISESVASNAGLGYLIVNATANFNVPLAFAALLVLAMMGTVLYSMFVVLEKRVIYWSR